MNEILEKYGISGIAIIGLSWFVMYLMRQHKEERKEWKDTVLKLNDTIVKINDEGNKTMKENTQILTGLKTLLEIRK